MPYVPPTSCPPIAQGPAAVVALYAVIIRRGIEDLALACEIHEAGPEFFPAYVDEVLQRSLEHDRLVAMFMGPVIAIHGAISDPAA